MATKAKKTKKRNPQDATMRNIRALKKRVEALEYLVAALTKDVDRLWTAGIADATGIRPIPALLHMLRDSKRQGKK